MQVGQARLVGECYNYRLLPSRVVVDTLHVMLAVGHSGDAAASLAADPPSSYFRIRCPPPPPSGPARAPAPPDRRRKDLGADQPGAGDLRWRGPQARIRGAWWQAGEAALNTTKVTCAHHRPVAHVACTRIQRQNRLGWTSAQRIQVLRRLQAARQGSVGGGACRLVSVVLETCGQYFSKGPVAARLDGFLLYLSRYLRAKPEPPLDVVLDLQAPPPPFPPRDC